MTRYRLPARPAAAGVLLLLAVAGCTLVAANSFQIARSDRSDAWGPFAAASPQEARRLSDYHPALAGSAGDTGVFILDSGVPGGTVLVMGGTHGDEVAGVVAATLLLENARLEQGRLIVIPRVNNSAATYGLPQEGYPSTITLATAAGARRFRIGSRYTNPADQFPDLEVYVETQSRQVLAGAEARNLNRAYPGLAAGNLTQRIAFAVMTLIRQEQVALVIDLHEASPEYPVVNALVAHPAAMDVAALAAIELEMAGIPIELEPSPANLRGLSHREIGDASEALAVLLETANPAQGRLRGRTNAELVLSGRDPLYEKADRAGRLFAPYPPGGYSLDGRVARHIASITTLLAALAQYFPERAIVAAGLPTYAEVLQAGAGGFLGKGGRP